MARFWRAARPSGLPAAVDDPLEAASSGSIDHDTLRLQSQVRARAQSQAIERRLGTSTRPPSATLLILGASEDRRGALTDAGGSQAGKSTICRQARLAHDRKAIDGERPTWRWLIWGVDHARGIS